MHADPASRVAMVREVRMPMTMFGRVRGSTLPIAINVRPRQTTTSREAHG